ncbi:hypothetical protein [Novosphingobium sp. BL-52-GroH]|uniref:hypothetical protein n=1 Tax=Novosphingobium sp. BL-52-GroH TaxID=3349877 RepID=UPI00384EDDB0
MLACLSEDVVRAVNLGGWQEGRIVGHMDRCYGKRFGQVVLMRNADGTGLAATFMVHGEYLATAAGITRSPSTITSPTGSRRFSATWIGAGSQPIRVDRRSLRPGNAVSLAVAKRP